MKNLRNDLYCEKFISWNVLANDITPIVWNRFIWNVYNRLATISKIVNDIREEIYNEE